jgi:hypothetical protein
MLSVLYLADRDSPTFEAGRLTVDVVCAGDSITGWNNFGCREGLWGAPHFLVHDKWEIVQLIERLQCSQLITRWLLPTPFLSQAALNSFGVA